MTREFDELLRSSAPVIPDPGDVRRLNRRTLKRSLVVHSRRRSFGSLVLVGSLALAFLTVGHVGELGSGDFELTPTSLMSPEAASVGVSRIDRVGFHGAAVPRMEGMTDEQVQELALEAYNDEGKLLSIEGWETDRGSAWSMGFASNAGGEGSLRARAPKGTERNLSREFLDFIVNDQEAVKKALQQVPSAPSREETIDIEGVPHVFQVWTFKYPGLGTVNYYRWEAPR